MVFAEKDGLGNAAIPAAAAVPAIKVLRFIFFIIIFDGIYRIYRMGPVFDRLKRPSSSRAQHDNPVDLVDPV